MPILRLPAFLIAISATFLAGFIGMSLLPRVDACANVALPMASWSRIATNQFNGSGNFNLTNPINPATPQLFYRLQLP